jgi:hypothetical protein
MWKWVWRITTFLWALADCAYGQQLEQFTILEVEPVQVRTYDGWEKAALRIENWRGSSASCGSGGLIDSAGDVGVVLTCAHLFSGGDGVIVVKAPDGRRYSGTLIDRDHELDLAMIGITIDHDLLVSPIADECPDAGDEIVTAGYGGGGLRSLKTKVVAYSKQKRRWDMHGGSPLRSGDSGSLVWNIKAKVVGVGWGTSGGQMYVTALPAIRDFCERPKVVQWCGLFRNRGKAKGCGPFGCRVPPKEAKPESPVKPDTKPAPRPDQPTPIPKPDRGEQGPQGPPGPAGRDTAVVDLQPVIARLDAMSVRLTALEQRPTPKPAGELLPIQKESKISHFVLVAYQEGQEWSRLNDLIGEAKKVHPVFKFKDASELKWRENGPSLWTYGLDGAELAVDRGYNEVDSALRSIARGDLKR